MMKEKILKTLKEIEKENNVKIIFAADTGSRTLGYSNENSDYDIRFIYVQKSEKYFKLIEEIDMIQRKELNMDFLGFDLKKTLNLLKDSNVQIWQWLYSSKIYVASDYSEEIKKLSKEYFEVKKFFHQYAGIISKNYKRKIKNKEKLKAKYYLISLIRIASMLKIENETEYNFSEGIEKSLKVLPENIKEKIIKMNLERKNGKKFVELDFELNNYIENKIKIFQEKADNLLAEKKDIEKINNFFFRIISERIKNRK